MKSAISANNRVPAWAAMPLPSAVTDNDGRGLVRFTLEVPFSRGYLLLRNFKFPREEGLFRVYQPVFTPAS